MVGCPRVGGEELSCSLPVVVVVTSTIVILLLIEIITDSVRIKALSVEIRGTRLGLGL